MRTRRNRLVFFLLAAPLVAGVFGAGLRAAQYVPPAPEQPIPYSHRQHLAMNLQCQLCHEMPEPGDQATLPPTKTCMVCHIQAKRDSPYIQQLAEANTKGDPIAWKRVYVLPDFIYAFSHKTHVTSGGVACETCHGPVREMERMQKVKDLSMATCIGCHQEKSAPTGCATCHEPM